MSKETTYVLLFLFSFLLLLLGHWFFFSVKKNQPAPPVKIESLMQEYKETWDECKQTNKEWFQLEEDARKFKNKFADAEDAEDKVNKAIEYFKSQKIADNAWEKYVSLREKCDVLLKKIESYVKERN